jgi:hypothetical protein
MGAIIQDANHWYWISVLDAACQIVFAGNGYNGLGSIIYNNSPR